MPPKSTGCLTCRKRRVRCDLRRPGCERCSRHGVPCPGYASEIGVLEFKDQTDATARRVNLRHLKTTVFTGSEHSFESSFVGFNATETSATPLPSQTRQHGTPHASGANGLDMPPTIISITANREQLYETFMGIYNPKTIGTRSQGFDFMRMLAVLAPSDLILRDGLDALSLIQVGSTHADQRLLSESVVRYGKTLRGIRHALSGTSVIEDTVLATASVLAICEFFDHMKENPSAWFGHMGGFDQILLARGPESLNTKLSMLLYYQSRFPALSRSLLRRKADPLSSPQWRAVLRKMPLGMSGEVMNLALQVPELLERYDALHAGTALVVSEVNRLLGDCECLDTEYSEWYARLQRTVPASETPCYTTANIDQFPTYAALIPDRNLTTGYLFSDQKYSFLHQQYWSSFYFLRTTISHLHNYLQQQSLDAVERFSRPSNAGIHSTSAIELDNIVFCLCRCIPGFAEPATGAYGHTAMFLPLRIATSHFRSRQMWDWARWADTVRARIFYKGIRPPAVKSGDFPKARSLV